MHSYSELVASLNGVDWHPAGRMDPCVRDLLDAVARRPSLVREHVASWAEGDLEERGLRCHETSTHYKWFVHYDPFRHYRIWLHQYKPKAARRPGHAEVPHNHRYSLASVILNGGFMHHMFETIAGRLREIADLRRSYQRGDTYIVRYDEIHKLSALSDDTITLVVESPVVRHFSEAFYGDSAVRFYDFVGMHDLLHEAVEAICHGGALVRHEI